MIKVFREYLEAHLSLPESRCSHCPAPEMAQQIRLKVADLHLRRTCFIFQLKMIWNEALTNCSSHIQELIPTLWKTFWNFDTKSSWKTMTSLIFGIVRIKSKLYYFTPFKYYKAWREGNALHNYNSFEKNLILFNVPKNKLRASLDFVSQWLGPNLHSTSWIWQAL